ncbi:XRE family transcriptional regulator [Actinoallomurus rhizosphaericola]|uniref:XRE family transcriptional regulator n=1 Tax=Actinoallomurus rhizosphaericola TaxID=2952536 RepID=UPI002092EC24|nr:XRE family transcriptional regulator [Actinoallomurus rhizosphaericola]MCO5995769.1 XRE family transcriptional regulator [Actinoallomurus rhizosphaericola]
MNEVLRRALAEACLSEQDVAARLGVDVKTVRRWLDGRRPYLRHRSQLADLLGVEQAKIWRAEVPAPPSPQHGGAEIEAFYAHRWAVPRNVWQWLFSQAEREIGILVYSGLFLAEDIGILRIIEEKADAGVPVRILLGDPNSSHVAERGADEGVGEAMAAKIRNSIVLHRPLREIKGVEIRLHRTVLYASLYRADDDLLVNPHAYGIAASNAPVLHVRHVERNDVAGTYLDSFNRVWRLAQPLA